MRIKNLEWKISMVLLVLCMLYVASCSSGNKKEERPLSPREKFLQETEEYLSQKEESSTQAEDDLRQKEVFWKEKEVLSRYDKAIFAASVMRFDNNFALPSLAWAHLVGNGVEVVLVHSEEEAVGYPDDVIVAWPSVWSQGMLEEMNQYVQDDDIRLKSLEDGVLTYPVTIENLVDNWRNVHSWTEGHFQWQSEATSAVRERYGREYNQNWYRQWFLMPGRLEVLNEYLEGEDLSEFDLTWPIAEGDVREDSMHILKVAKALVPMHIDSIGCIGVEHLWEIAED